MVSCLKYRVLLVAAAWTFLGCTGSSKVDELVGESGDGFGIGTSALTFYPTSHHFGNVRTGQVSATQTFTVSNVATDSIYIDSVGSAANLNFELVSHTCPISPAAFRAKETCEVRVRFTPQSGGLLDYSLRFRFGAEPGSTPYTATNSISGTGVSPLTFSGLASISSVTHNAMTLNWTANADATSYMIFRMSSGSMVYEKTVVNTGGTVANSTITGLTPATVYTYRVRAVDNLGIQDTNTSDVSATTLSNTAPVLAAIANPSVFAGTTAASINANTTLGGDIDADGDALTYTCVYDQSIDGSVAAGTNCSALVNEGGGNPAFNAATGVFSGWIPQYTETGGTFEFKITGTDPYSSQSTAIFSTTVQSGVPLLTSPTDLLFPAAYVDQGVAGTLNFDNNRSGIASDTGMTYACVFDRVVDGSVSAGSNCTSLSGTATFNTSTGVLSWTPDTSAWGAYEILVTGTNTAGSDTEIAVINVREPYFLTGLLRQFDSAFATTSGGQGLNSPLTSAWTDLQSSLGSVTAALSGFTGVAASGWNGSVSNTTSTAHSSPYRLTFDGSDDGVDFGAIANSNSSAMIDVWVRPGSAADKGRAIAGYGDLSGKGLQILSSEAGDGTVNLNVGYRSYAEEVMADSPIGYWRMNSSAYTLTDVSGNSNSSSSWSGPTTGGESGLAALSGNADPSTAFTTGYIQIPDSPTLSVTGNTTAEMWIKPGALGGVQVLFHKENQFTLALSGTGVTYAHSGNWCYACTGAHGAVSNNQWYHIAVVHTVGVGYDFYINGAYVDSYATTGSMTDNSNPLCIGSYGCSSMDFNGLIDEVAFYPSALSSARLAAHYAAASRSTCQSKTHLADNNWYHLGAIFNGTNDTLSLTVDGQVECSLVHPTAQTIEGSTANLKAGVDTAGNSSSRWTGSLGALRAYSSGTSANSLSNYTAGYRRYLGITAQAPQLISGIQAWYRSDAIAFVADTQAVAKWPDMSGNGYDLTQTTSGNRPAYYVNVVNGHPAVRFDGTNDYMTASIGALNAPFTVFAVGKFQNATQPSTNYDYIYAIGASAALQHFSLSRDESTNRYYIFDGTSALFGTSLTGGQFIQVSQQTATSAPFHQAWQNGVSLSATDLGGAVNTDGSLNVGRYAGGAHFLDGYVAELIFYNRALSTNERQAIEAYLKIKYGL